ncbi:MAG TPA: SDR family oxidoreductase [Acidobacteriaceae bacterium]|nr:SDR family oxidoreductase [Acidobacteriaceae bacterium]
MAKPVAVITGASSGIGAVFARKLAAEYDLLLIARRQEKLEALAAELRASSGTAVEVLSADLAEERGLAEAAERVAAVPALGLLVNNAGFGSRGLFWEAELAEQEQMHRLHVMATMRLSHVALQKMVAQNAGAIINVASVAAFVHKAGSSSYGATKSWMATFTEGLSLDLKSAGSAVQVQALCPGYTYSEFHDRLQVDRAKVAGAQFWLTAEFVVEESLRGLRERKVFVVPGWRYRALVGMALKLPVSLRLAVESAGSKQQDARDPKPDEGI